MLVQASKSEPKPAQGTQRIGRTTMGWSASLSNNYGNSENQGNRASTKGADFQASSKENSNPAAQKVAQRSAFMFDQLNIKVNRVIENKSWFT